MWLIKSEEETNTQHGKRPDERTVEECIQNSLIFIDKHSGPTSQEIDNWIKKIFSANKTGHHGTLDPHVTGVLPIAIDNATKVMTAMVGLDKEYVGVMHLHKEVDEKILRETAAKFIGKIKQLPPVKSAVARKIRERQIYFFDILEIDRKDVLFKVGCEAGTYVRKLCSDVGIVLGVGAHMSELRRTKVGNFTEEQSHSLVAVKDAYEEWRNGNEKPLRRILIPVEYAIPHVKRVFVSDSTVDAICHGSPLYVGGITRIQKNIQRDELIAVYSLKEELVAIGVAKMTSEEMFKNNKGIAVKTDKVLMKIGTYPSWKKNLT